VRAICHGCRESALPFPAAGAWNGKKGLSIQAK